MVILTIEPGCGKTKAPAPLKPMTTAQGLTLKNVLGAAKGAPDNNAAAMANTKGHPWPCIGQSAVEQHKKVSNPDFLSTADRRPKDQQRAILT
jgi:hypothetical protein